LRQKAVTSLKLFLDRAKFSPIENVGACGADAWDTRERPRAYDEQKRLQNSNGRLVVSKCLDYEGMPGEWSTHDFGILIWALPSFWCKMRGGVSNSSPCGGVA